MDTVPRFLTDSKGEAIALPTSAIKRAKIDAASAGDNQLVPSVADKKICVLAMLLGAKDPVDVTFYSGNQAGGVALTGTMTLAANKVIPLPAPADPRMHWLETAVAQKLNLFLSAAKQVSGCLVYYEGA